MPYKLVDLRTSVDPNTGERITPDEFIARGHTSTGHMTSKINTAWEAREAAEPAQIGMQIVSDIKPYKSMITGEMITGRKQHRDHLKAHNCIEVGNEKPKPFKPEYVGGVATDIKQAMEKHGVH